MMAYSAMGQRQHIECTHPKSWEHFILDLSKENSVMGYVYALGTEKEYRFEKKLTFIKKNDRQEYVYQTLDAHNNQFTREAFFIPEKFIGKALHFFNIQALIKNLQNGYQKQITLTCHSSIF